MKKMMIYSMFIIASQISLASTVGIGYGISNEFIKTGKKNYVFPVLNYSYDNYFVDTTRGKVNLGYRFLQDDIYTFSLYAIPFGGYKIKAKDLEQKYRSIDDRDYQIMLGSELKYYNDIYDVETSINAEAGKKGGKLSLSFQKPYVVNSNLILRPSISFNYFTSNFVDYYFGIDGKEASSSLLLEKYDGDRGYSLGIGVSSSYRLTDAFSLLGFIGVSKYSKDMGDSPIVENDLIYTGGVGIIYTF